MRLQSAQAKFEVGVAVGQCELAYQHGVIVQVHLRERLFESGGRDRRALPGFGGVAGSNHD
jgi:hypothetical protein